VLIDVGCPGCGSERSRLLFDAADPLSGDRFGVRRCDECSLVHVSPRPDDERLASYYPDGYFGARHRFFNEMFMELRARALPPATKGSRVLDIGCGRGDFLLACRRRGWQIVGVEQDVAPILSDDAGGAASGTRAKPPVDFPVYSTHRLGELESDSFDAVTMWHVFEHLADARGTLREIRRLLRPGGVLIIEVPNFASWQARIGRDVWFHLEVPRHLLQF
jgi:2-polyprenyl-3-methyl-5-hydroxy-6-metoxy-1,4-benzoquinol methylase